MFVRYLCGCVEWTRNGTMGRAIKVYSCPGPHRGSFLVMDEDESCMFLVRVHGVLNLTECLGSLTSRLHVVPGQKEG